MSIGNRQATLYLPLNTVVNSKVKDLVNDNDGSLQGNPKLVADNHLSACISFDGTDDFIEIQEPFANDDDFTISLWVNPAQINTGTYQAIIGHQGDVYTKRKPGIWLHPNNGAIHYDSYDHTNTQRFHGILNNFFIQANEWVHLTWVKEGTTYRFYRNGALFATQPAPVKFYTTTASYWIGKIDQFWNGKIAHVRIYANPLSQQQVLQDIALDQKGLLVHLPMNDLVQGGGNKKLVKDLSGNDNHGSTIDNTKLVIDDDFGPVLNFDGADDRVELAPLAPGKLPVFTIQVWVYADNLDGWRSIRNDKGWSSGNLHFQFLNKKLEFSIHHNNPGDQWFDQVFEPHTWYNLALCYNQYEKEVKLYINGAFAERRTYNSAVAIKPSAFWIGAWDGGGRWTDGRMTGFRMYNRVLSLEEIRRNMMDDQGAAASYRQSHPFNFDFFEADAQGVIYIDDIPANHTINFQVTNSSNQQITLKPLGEGVPTTDSHHFELRFRPGTLSAATLEKITLGQDAEWQMSRPIPQNNGTVSVYLKGPGSKKLPPAFKKELNLLNITAAPKGGTRGTKVEILYKNFYYGNDSRQVIAGNKTEHLNIVNHRGRKNIPLHVGFMGPNTVLNDGTSENVVQLRITNILEEDAIPLNKKTNNNAEEVSKFIISFDAGAANKEWALGTRSQLESIDVEVNFGDDPNAWVQIPESSHGQGISPQWEIECTIDKLMTNQHIQIKLSKIKTGHPTGHTNVYLHYENIPGYWEGQFVVPIEKTRLVQRDIFDINNNYTGESRVGIGVANPRTDLDLGKTIVSGALNDYTKAQFTLSGGGQATWEGAGGRLKWTQRFIAISIERPNSFLNGFVDIHMPATDIPGTQVYNGQARSANANGVILHAWEALYAVHKIGGNYRDISYRIINYTSNAIAPTNWILVAVVNGDNNSIKLGTGKIINARSASFNGSSIPKGMIMMWSGAVNQIPYGWVLCNGTNGTPDLRNRFLVGAGHTYNPGNVGGSDSVALNVNQVPAHNHSGSTSQAGNHQHWMEGEHAHGLSHRHRTIPGQTTVDMGFGGGSGADPNDKRWRGHVNTNTVGNHAHSLSTSNTGGNQAHENRPPYYALAFIMKL